MTVTVRLRDDDRGDEHIGGRVSAWVYADPVSGFMAPLSASSC